MLNVIINGTTVLALHPETGKEVWRRPLGAYTLNDCDSLANAKVRVLEEVVRIICPRDEFVLDAATGRVQQRRRRGRLGTGRKTSQDVDLADHNLDDLLRELKDELE